MAGARGAKRLLWLGLSLAAIPACAAEQPAWAKAATPLDLSCSHNSQPISAPDHRASAQVLCQPRKDDDPAYSLQVKVDSGRIYEVPLQKRTQELLWAPDSKALLVNGSQGGYWGSFVTVYELTQNGLRKLSLTNTAQRDMVVSFPPCKAAKRNPSACTRISRYPEYNMSGVGWAQDSKSVFVFAEVPCSSSYGGTMCQVLGYQLSLPDGNILKRLTAPQVKTEWHSMMGWTMHVPDPPIYGQS